jgi:hypothetical protein
MLCVFAIAVELSDIIKNRPHRHGALSSPFRSVMALDRNL